LDGTAPADRKPKKAFYTLQTMFAERKYSVAGIIEGTIVRLMIVSAIGIIFFVY